MAEFIFIAVILGLIYFKARSAGAKRQSQGGSHGENFPFPTPLETILESMPSEMTSGSDKRQDSALNRQQEPSYGDLMYNQEGEYIAPVPQTIIPRSSATGLAESDLQPQLVEQTLQVEPTNQSNNFKAKDFDLRSAVIYREIMDPKYQEY